MADSSLKVSGRSSGAWILARIGAALATVALAAVLLSGGCATASIRPDSAHYQPPKRVRVLTTGYCNCRKCCGWRYNWYGRPVYSGGRLDGKPKKVGLTASGVRAHAGTLAADTSVFPMGTIIEVPGYGFGRVEDRGGGVRGSHIDLWFNSHKTALHWGRKELEVRVWLPKGK